MPPPLSLSGGSSGTVGVLRLNNSSSNSSTTNLPAAAAAAANGDGDPTLSWEDDPHVVQLVSYGYPPEHAMAQLQAAKGSLLMALHTLQQQLLIGSAAAAVEQQGATGVSYAAAAAAAEECPQEWVDEVEVLGAIYGEELDASQHGVVTLAVEGGEQVRGGGPFFFEVMVGGSLGANGALPCVACLAVSLMLVCV